MTLIVVFILIFLYKSHWSHSTQWLKNIRRKFRKKGDMHFYCFRSAAMAAWVALRSSSSSICWGYEEERSNLLSTETRDHARYLVLRPAGSSWWRIGGPSTCYFAGLEMVDLVRIPFPRRPRPLPRLDLRLRLFGPDSGGHCGFEITNERATRRKFVLKPFSQHLTIFEENRSRCFPFQL